MTVEADPALFGGTVLLALLHGEGEVGLVDVGHDVSQLKF